MSTDFRGFDPKGLPLVSIVATCYNQEQFLEETLDSIKAQTYPNIQLIIMDDCSQDRSVIKIEEWIKKNKVKCKFIAHKENVGICKTLNEALEHCDGTYYQAFACDDVMFPDKIERQVQEFEKSEKDVMVIFSEGITIDEYGKIIPRRKKPDNLKKDYSKILLKYITYSDFFGDYFFGIIPAGSVLMKRKVFELVGTYDEELVAEDTDMWLRIIKGYKIKYFKKDVFKYRLLKTSLTKTARKSDRFYYTVFKLLYKQIENKSISKEIINNGFKKYIKGLYVLNDRTYWFRIIIKNKFSLFVCFHYLLSSLGLTYHQGVKISKLLKIYTP